MRTGAQCSRRSNCSQQRPSLTAMRQEEICRARWNDLNLRTKMLTIRDRKDPREKKGNDQRIPLLAVSGYDAIALVEEQRAIRNNGDDRIFPYVHKSAGTAFTRTCRDLKIEDLHSHDLRHEGTESLVRGRIFDSASRACEGPQGLEDAAPVHASEAGDIARRTEFQSHLISK